MFWEIQSRINCRPFLTEGDWSRLCAESAAHNFFQFLWPWYCWAILWLGMFFLRWGKNLSVWNCEFWNWIFVCCLLCRLQPGLRRVPGLGSKAENVFVGTSGVVFPFLFRLRELQMCIAHTSLRFSRFFSLPGLLIFHPRWWVLNNYNINQCTLSSVVKVTGLNFLCTLSCQECQFRWSRSTQEAQGVWWPGGCPPSRLAVCGRQEGHGQQGAFEY